MEKKLRENARWNVNKNVRCLVRNKTKHRKKYKIGKSPTPEGKISIVLFTRLAELENDYNLTQDYKIKRSQEKCQGYFFINV